LSLHAVVLAAGEGRRLRPLTERWPKPILPIDGRPVIGTLLDELAQSGIGSAIVVTGHLAEKVEALVGDGSSYGLEIAFARQPEPLGSADALRKALEVGARAPLLVVAADTVFQPGSAGRAANAWEESGVPGGLAVRHSDDDEQTAVAVENGRVVGIGGVGSGLRAAPLWFFSAELIPYVERTAGPPFELAAAVQEAMAEGIEIVALDVGPTRDLPRPADVVVENFPYLSNGV
jgi:NDP-sugar pyrophosphorylase family protein